MAPHESIERTRTVLRRSLTGIDQPPREGRHAAGGTATALADPSNLGLEPRSIDIWGWAR